jgi:uncharacterized membrane protein
MKKLLLQTSRAWLILLATVVIVGAYIWQSSPELPPMVASGFDAAGNPHKMTTRESYRSGVIFTAVFMPLCVALMILFASMASPGLISIPNREYWLRPERIGDMRKYITQWGIAFAIGLGVFMTGIHTLILAAHMSKPPVLSQAVWVLVVVFLLFTGAMIVLLIRHFKKIDVANPSIGGRLQAKNPQNARRY